MCGFIGFVTDINDKRISIYEEKFQHYLNQLKNRGPDYTETKQIFLKDKFIKIGFSRLAIQDLNQNANKIFHNDNAILLFNGEIYNKKYLKRTYIDDIILTTSTDTEVLFNLLLNYGTKIIKEIRGIFSIVFINLKKHSIECIRDFTGTKPLYYSTENKNFFFSSEAWFLYSVSQKKLNNESFNFFLNFGFPPEENTLIENVKKVKSRNILKIDLKTNKIDSFEYFNLNKTKNTNKLHSDDVLKDIDNAVEINLLADTKIGTFLSGGIDSSLITILSKKYNTNIEGFTTVYLPEKKYEKFNIDYEYSKKLAKDLNINLNVNFIENISNTLDDFYKVTNYLDEPISNLNFLNTYWQSKQAKSQGFKVILTGDGSDELLCGYDRYHKLFLSHYLRFFSTINKKVKNYNTIKNEKIPHFFYSIFNYSNLNELLNNSNYTKESIKINSLKNLNFNSKVDYINYFDFRYWLTNESNFKLDKCTMINSIEARVPFQDPGLIESFFFTENSKKFSFFNRKYLLKKNNLIPKYIKNRKKTGWFTPENMFLETNLTKIISDVFVKNEIKNQDIFNQKNLDYFFNSFKEKGFLLKREITTIILFQIWYNKVLSSK